MFRHVSNESSALSTDILSFTECHPYYTQQLAYYCYFLLEGGSQKSSFAVEEAITTIVETHSNDYGRLWNTLSKTDKKLLIALSENKKISSIAQPTSTSYSGLKRLTEKGYLIKNEEYEIEDPFFKTWLIEKRSIR